MAEAAGILARRSRRELRLALEQHDIGDAELGEMPGDAASHAPAAGDDHIRGLFHYFQCIRPGDPLQSRMITDALRDARHALRLLARSPMFAIVAVLSLGIGIGSNVAMFSVVDALLLK
jgi:hypothetical protein